MLDRLQRLPDDPILGLAAAARADDNPDKVDLTVGIYMDEQGLCPVFDAVREAQRRCSRRRRPRRTCRRRAWRRSIRVCSRWFWVRTAMPWPPGVSRASRRPGAAAPCASAPRWYRPQRPARRSGSRIPSWPVHIPCSAASVCSSATYRYYDPASHGVNFDAMVDDLRAAGSGDLVLLHGCCHNPCGADLTLEQWGVIADMAEQQGFMPFIDIAYQGLGDGLEEDAAGLRLLAARLPEMIVAASCSKNMGLYRERTGVTLFLCQDAENADALLSQAKVAARRVYSMPPAHGALLAGRVLSDPALSASWKQELLGMCARINGLRSDLVEKLQAATGRDFEFIRREKGMFSFLGLSKEQVTRLREEHSVYMLGSSRINVAGVNAANIDYLAAAIGTVSAA
jgi:aspartate aminotransferase